MTGFGGYDIALAVPLTLLGDICLLSCDLLLLLAVVLFVYLSVEPSLLHTASVIAVIEFRLMMLDGKGLIRHAVEKISVVRDHKHALFVLYEVVFKPAERFDIEMVGRLVEHKDIRLAAELNRQGESCLLSSREKLDVLFYRVLVKAELE